MKTRYRNFQESGEKRIVVCGMGAVTTLGNYGPDNDELWRSLLAGKTGFRHLHPIDPQDPENSFGIKAQVVGDLFGFDPEQYKDDREWSRRPNFTGLDKAIQIGLVASNYAVSSLDMSKVDPERAAVSVGIGLGGGRSSEASLKSFLARGPNIQMGNAVVNTMPNGLAGRASICFQFKGPSFATPAACASSLYALFAACDMVKLGRTDVVLVIGTEACATPHYLATFQRINALTYSSSLNASMPFGLGRDGFVMSEGAGALIITSLEYAKKMGWPIVAEIAGYAANSGAQDIVVPNSQGTRRCMELALEDARLDPAQIDAINAHGTSTPEGDLREAEAISRVFGNDPSWNPFVWSTKANLGHLLGGAGMVESIVSIMTLVTGKIHPMGEYALDRDCLFPCTEATPNGLPLNIVTGGAELDKRRTAVMNSSFGFGDTNGSVIFTQV
ncbi:MAG: beta-ketoacyl-[acyl-carrier-protein] synthase family protein [bacterium]|nr:beta-ketoacyl-[acyl-carrier-protein] synthase family protein [bacterium]